MQRLVYSEYSGLNYPDDSWSARAHRLLRALWIIGVAATIGGIGGGSVALALLHLTGGSSRQENVGVAVKPQSVTHPAAARLPRIAASPAAAIPAAAPTATAPRTAVSAAAPTVTASPAAVSPAAPTTPAPTASPVAVSPAAPTTPAPTASPVAVSAAAPTATAPPAAVSAAAPSTTAPPAAVSAAAPSATAPPAAVKPAPASAVPAVPSPSHPADQQTRIASAPATTEAGDDAAASTPGHPPVRPRALAHVGRHATRLNRPDRYALAENARSHPRSHYESAYDRHHYAYIEARRSRYPQNWAYDNWGGGGYWRRRSGWGGGGYRRPGGWGGGGGDWGD